MNSSEKNARIVWALLFLIVILLVTRSLRATLASARSLRTVAILGVAALFLAVNWGTYVYAVESNQVVQGSLGYFINPLAASVALLTTATYIFFYTPLKLRTSLSTIAGAVPGALPAVILRSWSRAASRRWSALPSLDPATALITA